MAALIGAGSVRRRAVRRGLGLAALATLVLAGGCRESGEGGTAGVHVGVRIAPTPPVPGPARVLVTVESPAGDPIEGVRVTLEATMEHPGMLPVRATASEPVPGRYIVPEVRFGMAGEWILIVTADLPEGGRTVHEHRFRVVSLPPPDAR